MTTPYTRQSPEQRELGRLRDLEALLTRRWRELGQERNALFAELTEINRRILAMNGREPCPARIPSLQRKEKSHAPETVPPNG